MRWFLEIFIGIILFPVAIILGLVLGVYDFYSSYHKAIERKLNE